MLPGEVTVRMRIREAAGEDLPAVLAIDRASPEAPHWAPELYAAMLTPPSANVRTLLVAELDGVVVGFAAGALAGTGAGRWGEIESVAVEPGCRRAGVGRALCKRLMAWASANGAQHMELEVRHGSAGAQALYRQCGFREDGRRRGYYRDPPEDAVLMSADLVWCP